MTYYDKDKDIKTPIAFVFSIKRESGYEDLWGKVDQGFVSRGDVDRIWHTLLSTEEWSIQDQLTGMLLLGFNKAGEN